MTALGMGEDRASCYAHKQRMTTAETWDARRKVGPDVAAEKRREACSYMANEIEKDERGYLLKTGRYSPLWKHCQRTPNKQPNEQS